MLNLKAVLVIVVLLFSVSSFGQVKDTTFWNHVHHQSRLTIVSYDSTVIGKLLKINRELDGDYHLLIQSDSNHIIVGEIICACKGIMISCRGYKNRIPIPKVGDLIRIEGDSVKDRIHRDLLEIHPIKQLTILKPDK
jgi:hypothetical protein